MKRKILSLMLALAAVLTLTLPASADLVWTPDNAFYENHWEECTYVGRGYETAGYGGTVTLWDAPNGAVLETVLNGQRGTVQFTWSGDGVEWGCFCNYSEDWGRAGWVPMDDLSLIYDSQQFIEDHRTEIVSVNDLTVDFDTAVVYSYPGGPLRDWVLKEDPDYMPFSQAFSSVYTDDSGLRWGYVGYYMGHVEGWVCLDNPMNEQMDTNIVPISPSVAQVRESATVTPKAGQQFQLILAVVLVAVVVVVTAFAIFKLRPKKKEEG